MKHSKELRLRDTMNIGSVCQRKNESLIYFQPFGPWIFTRVKQRYSRGLFRKYMNLLSWLTQVKEKCLTVFLNMFLMLCIIDCSLLDLHYCRIMIWRGSRHIAAGMFLRCKWQSIVRVACAPAVALKGKIMGMKEQISVSICLSACVCSRMYVYTCAWPAYVCVSARPVCKMECSVGVWAEGE